MKSFRRRAVPVAFAVFVALCAGCGLFKKEGTVTLTQADAGVKIDNGTFLDIHYVLGEEDFLESHTWWGGDMSRPQVDAEDAVVVTFAMIPNGLTASPGPGDRIVMYWWDREYEDMEDLHKLAVDLK